MSPFVGPSYQLASPKAAYDRSINLYLVPIETAGKAPFMMESVPGTVEVADLGAPIRGCLTTNDRTFFVAGSSLFEYAPSGTTLRGSLASDAGPVSMDYGTSQLVIVDGSNGYVLTLANNAFQTINADGFYGSDRVAFLDNYFLLVRPDTGQFYITGINDATSIDALDFATAESNPDNLVAVLAVQRRLLLFGTNTTEIWFNSGNSDFPFEREGTTIEVGCEAAHSVRVVDNTAFWLGRDKNGSGIVYRLQGYQAVRISTRAIERALQQSTDLSAAVGYSYQQDGLTFYAITAPGVKTVFVYEVATQAWHERCDLDSVGQFIADRGVCHTFNFGQHLIGGSDGKVYRLDAGVHTKAGAPLVRERISPHAVTAALRTLFFQRLSLDCSTGEAGQGVDTSVELSWLDWKPGARWSNPIARSIGRVGERFARLVWSRLGMSADRVWKLRYSGNAPFSILNVAVEAEEGTR